MSGAGEGEISKELQEFIAMQQAQQQMQQTVATITEKCWEKCIGTPGRYLSGREETCISDCAKRFIETTHFIIQRSQQQNAG